jgi:hypothetical protein
MEGRGEENKKERKMRGMRRREKGRVKMKWRTIRTRKSEEVRKKKTNTSPMLFFRSVRSGLLTSFPRHEQFDSPYLSPVRVPVAASTILTKFVRGFLSPLPVKAGIVHDRFGFTTRPPLLIERSACWAANKPCDARHGSFVCWQWCPAVCSSICPSHLSATVLFLCCSRFF